MKLKYAAVIACDDDGNKIAGPFFLPLTQEDKAEINALKPEYGPIETPTAKP